MTDLVWICFVIVVTGSVVGVVLYVTRRPPVVQPEHRAPEFDALERVVTAAFEANREIITIVAAEVSKAAIESAKTTLESMTVGGTTQEMTPDENPEPPIIPDWTAAAIPDWVVHDPFPNPPTPPGEFPT